MANPVVAELRRLVPPARPLSLPEAKTIAELQATRFLARQGIVGPPVPASVISTLPRIFVAQEADMPVPGCAHWAKGDRWVILLNQDEPRVRRRFSLAHEFKHVLDNPFLPKLYPASQAMSYEDFSERVANVFAACLLMPKPWVKRASSDGITDPWELAQLFEVSQAAMQIRLRTLGLSQIESRHFAVR